MANIGILGARGRMGRAIAAALAAPDAAADGLACAGETVRGDDPVLLARRADVLVDFTAPGALSAHLDAAKATGTALLIGTTGLSDADHAAIDAAADTVAVLQTGNTSIGIALLARLARQAAAALGANWDIEIVEAHHRFKADAPSGTALLLGQAAAAGRGTMLSALRAPPRDGIGGARADGEIGFAALRGGTVAGDHSVCFFGPEERLILSHHAENRAIFARGALATARWLAGKAPGRYTMDDVIG